MYSATSIFIEWIFSCSHLVLSPVRNRLSAQSTHALLCLRSWSLLGMVKDEDVLKVAVLDNEVGEEEVELEDGWDAIK
jgi:hypothetical protein